MPRVVLPTMEEPWDRRTLNTRDATTLSERLGESWTPVLFWMLAKEVGPGVGQVSRNTELSPYADMDRAEGTTQGGETPLCPSPLWL